MTNDSFDSIKEKYYDQAQVKTGVLAGVVKVLNEFVRKYDNAEKIRDEEHKNLIQNYQPNTALFEQKNMEIFNTFNDTVASIKDESRQKVKDTIQQVKDKVAEIISSNLPEGALSDITLIRSFAGTLSDAEAEIFLGKYEQSYLASKAIFEALTEEQRNRLGVKFISADNVIGSLDSIEETALKMINNYNGVFNNNVAVLLYGEWIQTVNDAFEKFVSAYGE